jgi:hypothetical protein
MATLTQWFRHALLLVRRHKRPYIIINVVYYGLVAASMVYVAGHPALQEALLGQVALSFTEGPLAGVSEAYLGGHVLQAMALTFLVNFFLGSVLVLLAPSLLIPFAGLGIGLIRATLWGLLLAPTTPELQAAMIPHSLTLVVEGQGYILAMLAVWVLGRAFVSPSSVGAASWGAGYVRGLKDACSVFLLVAVVLAVAAVYEALEVIYLVPLLMP